MEHENKPSSLQVTILGHQVSTSFPSRLYSAAGRSNLTALSQTHNLFFVALLETVCVYKPSFPEQKIDFEKPLVTLKPASIANRPGFIDDVRPHCINHIITEFIGSQEVLLMTHDDGDVFAYWVNQIDRIAEANMQFGRGSQNHEINPWLSYNVEMSAWGIAVHRRTRTIAISANTTRVTILKPALADPRSLEHESDPLSMDEDDADDAELDSGDRTSHFVQCIMETRQNLPCVSFCNFQGHNNDKISSLSSINKNLQNSEHQVNWNTNWPSYDDDVNSNSILAGNIVGQTFVWEINSNERIPDTIHSQTTGNVEQESEAEEEGPVLREMFTAHRCSTAPLACRCFANRQMYPHAVWGLNWLNPKWFRDEGRFVRGKIEPSGHWELYPELEGEDIQNRDVRHHLLDELSDDDEDDDDYENENEMENEEDEDEDDDRDSESMADDADDLITELTLAAGQNGERDGINQLRQSYNLMGYPRTRSRRNNSYLSFIERLEPVFRTQYFSAASQSSNSGSFKSPIPSYPILQMCSQQIALYTRNPVSSNEDWNSKEEFRKEFTTVAMQFPLSQKRGTLSQLSSPHYERFVYHALIPELSVFVAASLSGRAAIYSLEKVTIQPRHDSKQNDAQANRSSKNAQSAKGYGNEKRLGFSLIQVVPTKDQEESGLRPMSPMMGIAVSPIQGEQVIVDVNGQVLPNSGGSASRKGGSRRYRLLMTYADGSLMSYELSRQRAGLGVLQFV